MLLVRTQVNNVSFTWPQRASGESLMEKEREKGEKEAQDSLNWESNALKLTTHLPA